jgi:hypothetical protein
MTVVCSAVVVVALVASMLRLQMLIKISEGTNVAAACDLAVEETDWLFDIIHMANDEDVRDLHIFLLQHDIIWWSMGRHIDLGLLDAWSHSMKTLLQFSRKQLSSFIQSLFVYRFNKDFNLLTSII